MNHLAHETSPYLLQHADNPVDWYPWGDEAIAAAKAADKPIFLSIGYSACHWCHVMAHESFENAQIARLMNERFVNIKVDREERPDLDQIYMQAVQLLTGRGGWPMSVFLTHELKPFYGGTYWPPTARMGMPGFDQVLTGVSDAWQKRREEVAAQADQLTSHLDGVEHSGHAPAIVEPAAGEEKKLSLDLVHTATANLERAFDHQHGGFGSAPKFPHPMDLRMLLRWWRRGQLAGKPHDSVVGMVTTTLTKMAGGGIYDQLGGGFHRYSVDERWLVPHFEKMLYDNALLTSAYVEAWQATGNDDFARIVRETADFVLREITDPIGGFFSTLDADSEGEEGKFYVWTPQQIEDVLGADAAETFCHVYDVTDVGNFESTNILNLPKTFAQCAAMLHRDADELQADLAKSRAKLLAARARRVRPGLDDKVLVGWNGLMIDALAQAGAALDEPRYTAAAAKAAEFLLKHVRDKNGRLLHTWREGKAKFAAYLDDYAALANALVTLYEATFEERWIDTAVELADTLLARFADRTQGGFFFTADDHERLIARQKDLLDSSVPSGNALAATALVRLGKLCGRSDYLEAAEGTIALAAKLMERAPTASGQMLLALDMLLGPTQEVVIVSVDREEASGVLGELRRRFWPNRVVASRPGGGHSAALDPAFEGRAPRDKRVTLYLCENFACQEPVAGEHAIVAILDRVAPAHAR